MNKSLRSTLILIGLLSLLIGALFGLGEALVPLLISFGLSYLLFPLVSKLEGVGVKRSYAVPSVFATIVIFIGISLALILPNLISDTKLFLKELPKSSARAIGKIEVISTNLGYSVDLSKDSIASYLEEHVSEFSGGLLKGLSKGIKASFSGLAKWLVAILNLFLIPLFFFYLINDYEKITKELKSFIPKSILPKLTHYMSLSNKVLSGYIRGQLMVALTLGALYATGLTIVGLRFGILIGLISGIISIIPYAGFTLGFLTAIIMGLANHSSIGQMAGITSVFVIIQVFEGTLITPKIVGDKVGLSSLGTMLALIIGGNLFGLVGMVAAIPAAAISKTIIIDLRSKYHQLDFYKK